MIMELEPPEHLLKIVVFEQGYDNILIDNYFKFLETLEDDDYICHDMILYYENEEMTLRDALGEDIYCFFVYLYGDYGVSLRTGWIVNKEPFINFIEHLILDRLLDITYLWDDENSSLKELLENDLNRLNAKYNVKFSLSDMLDVLYDGNIVNEEYFRNKYNIQFKYDDEIQPIYKYIRKYCNPH